MTSKLAFPGLGLVLILGLLTAPAAHSDLPCARSGGSTGNEDACRACLSAGNGDPAIGYKCGMPGAVPPQPMPGTAPAVQNPFPKPPDCFVGQGPISNILKLCPFYSCSSILQDDARDSCNRLTSAGQAELINMVANDAPSQLFPPVRDAVTGKVLEVPDDGPCAGTSEESACHVLMAIVYWVSDLMDKYAPKETHAPGEEPVGCICIRG